MSDHPTDRLEALADAVVEEFGEYRPAGGFRAVSPVIDTSDAARPTLIVHIDHEEGSISLQRSNSSSLIVVPGRNENDTGTTTFASSQPLDNISISRSLLAP